jgi:nicotinamide-nucleotide amidase
MNHALLVIGNTLRTNLPLREYLNRVYTTHFHEDGDTFFIERNDTKLLFFLQELMERYETLTIATLDDGASLIGKVLCTLTQDALILQSQILAPSKALHVTPGSYTIKHNENYINVLQISLHGAIGPIHSPSVQQRCVFHLVGLDTQACQVLLEPLAQTFDVSLHVSPWVEGLARIEAKAQKFGQLEHFIKSTLSLFGEKFFLGNDPMSHIVHHLGARQKRITCAESCTGGLIVSLLTKVPGASECIYGTLVTYANGIKRAWLGVDEGILNTYGAVSEACVKDMLEGSLKASKSDFALATSGIAGPDGGSEHKPVGTVFVGVGDSEGGKVVERLLLKGDRESIQTQSAYHAFRLLLQTYPHIFLTKR